VTCPNGVVSTQWAERRSQQNLPVIRVRFSPADCRPCPHLHDCVNSPSPRRRELNLRQSRDEHETVRTARAEQRTDARKERYKTRAGVEGTIPQAVGHCGLRRPRYQGLAKTSLQHQLTGAATNLARIDAHLTDTPRARTRTRTRTRTSHFAALRPADQTIDGAKQAGPGSTNSI
ncbi:transposase, partial [Streptomyces sp. AVP053U2]|uniref:transposase n=1 Tax=Streptomyces sp. AVP053U2 TaxID=1737066 RepID=UPI00159F2248